VGDELTRQFRDARRFPSTRFSPYSHVHVRRERLGFVYHSRAIFCRAVPNLSVTIRNFCTAVWRRGSQGGWGSLFGSWRPASVQVKSLLDFKGRIETPVEL
jgi:hypothetical protein